MAQALIVDGSNNLFPLVCSCCDFWQLMMKCASPAHHMEVKIERADNNDRMGTASCKAVEVHGIVRARIEARA